MKSLHPKERGSKTLGFGMHLKGHLRRHWNVLLASQGALSGDRCYDALGSPVTSMSYPSGMYS